MCKGGGEAGDPRDLKAEQVEARAKRTVASAQQQVVRNKVQQSPVERSRYATVLVCLFLRFILCLYPCLAHLSPLRPLRHVYIN